MLRRRDVLRLMAGVPLVLGGGCAAPRSGGPPRRFGERSWQGPPVTLAQVLAEAQRTGRWTLLVFVPEPVLESGSVPRELRRRIAERLEVMLGEEDLATRLLLANLVIVVAGVRELFRAVPSELWKPISASDPPICVARPLPPDDNGRYQLDLERLPVRLHTQHDQTPLLVETLRALVFGPDDAGLGASAAYQLSLLEADERADVERALDDLGNADYTVRAGAQAELEGWVSRVTAVVSRRARATSDAEVRARCTRLLRIGRRFEPFGTQWKEEMSAPACPGACGMALPMPTGRLYLGILAGEDAR